MLFATACAATELGPVKNAPPDSERQELQWVFELGFPPFEEGTAEQKLVAAVAESYRSTPSWSNANTLERSVMVLTALSRELGGDLTRHVPEELYVETYNDAPWTLWASMAVLGKQRERLIEAREIGRPEQEIEVLEKVWSQTGLPEDEEIPVVSQIVSAFEPLVGNDDAETHPENER
jgi:hypothetical protein